MITTGLLIYFSGVGTMLMIFVGYGIYKMFFSKERTSWEKLKEEFRQVGWIAFFSWIAVALIILQFIDKRR